MKKEKKIYKKEEQLEWFNKIGIDEFAIWIKEFLQYGKTKNIVLNIGETDRDIFLQEYFYSVDDARFRENFWKAVKRLLLQWNYSHDDVSLLYKLFNIIGWTRNIDCFDRLLTMALDEHLKDVTYKNINMHKRLLAVLFGLRIHDDGIRSLVERDIKDYRFTQLCFRKSWEISGNIIDPIDYLPDLFECGRMEPSEIPSTYSTFSRFVRKTGIPSLKKNFEAIWKKLENIEDRKSLQTYLISTGLYHHVQDIEIEDKDVMRDIIDLEGQISIELTEQTLRQTLSSQITQYPTVGEIQ